MAQIRQLLTYSDLDEIVDDSFHPDLRGPDVDDHHGVARQNAPLHQACRSHSVLTVVLQKSILTKIRQLILDISNSTG